MRTKIQENFSGLLAATVGLVGLGVLVWGVVCQVVGSSTAQHVSDFLMGVK